MDITLLKPLYSVVFLEILVRAHRGALRDGGKNLENVFGWLTNVYMAHLTTLSVAFIKEI